MSRLEILRARLNRLNQRAAKLDEKAKASTEAAELEALTEQRSLLNEDISDLEAEIRALEEEKQGAATTRNDKPPANAQLRNGNITASYNTDHTPAQTRSEENVLESVEYRRAFMNYAQFGTPISAELRQRVTEYRRQLPMQYRAGDAIDTNETGAAIPLTIMREVINTVRKRYGNLYDRVRKMSIPGGVEFPIGELQANFHWITEDTVSPNQDIGSLGSISFRYNVAEIRIAQTFLSYILTMEAFEAKIVEVIALAYRKALDYGIVKGSGNGQMLGILNDTRVTGLSGHTIAMSANDINNWTAWRKKFFAKLPIGYRDGEFVFPMSTIDSYLETMADANNNPIFRQATGLTVNSGDAADPNGTFFGRRISIVEPDILPDFDTASSNDVVGFFWMPEESYAINENFGFTMRRYFDDRENKWIDKALCVVDGKVLNPYSIYLITKA